MLRKLLYGLCVLALVASGCLPIPTGRLDVNDGLRASCWWLTDAEIDLLITGCEVDRLNGMAWDTQIENMVVGVCGYEPGCSVCSTAIINQVYGVD